eukprot:CAMPEP_0170469530 /NCGR_PEP_ID=MMETSP0123-20130129/12325_1 /TAXON_ID=182087 /ORGANISM="Favella ehrenbergii, Strain Fehren 1" /LENGTH=106 /DNA_ID=CAMNT_0010736421 /DNA_START=276 /DNA_END=596 /DNA_ORIENTATION=-
MIGVANFDPGYVNMEFNNERLFRIKWVAESRSDGDLDPEVESISCRELVKSWTHLSQKERDSFLGEIALWGEEDFYLCPNTDFKYKVRPNIEHFEIDSFFLSGDKT